MVMLGKRVAQVAGVAVCGFCPSSVGRPQKRRSSLPADSSPSHFLAGHIVGRHIELVANERIVQAWRVIDWNPGVYSIVKFELAEHGSGTKLVFDHTGFPEG